MNHPPLPLTLAVVGHTNTGKTSLLRTLLRNTRFGEVEDNAGTTRHVEAAQLLLQGTPYIELRDTPGLEDSLALAEHLQQVQQQGLRGRACLTHFIDASHPHVQLEFEQEIKVLKQALQVDAMLYVVDCREAVLEKYRQEIAALALASRPILPVLNFIQADNANLAAWRHALAEAGLHALVEFDTVAFDFEAERRLYQKLQTLLEAWYSPLQTLMDHRAQEWQHIKLACIAVVADMLMDVATMTQTLAKQESRVQSVEALQNRVRQREQQALASILELLRFSAQDVELNNLPVQDGEWELDLFSPETLKAFGMDAASAAATGAAIGVGVDLLFAGLSLGVASLTGAAIGTAWHTGRRYGRDLLARIKGDKVLCVDDITLNVLLLRQLSLLRQLFRRGHAAVSPLRVETAQEDVKDQTIVKNPEFLKDPKVLKGWEEQRQAIRVILVTKASHDGREYRQVHTHLQQWLTRVLDGANS